MLLIPQPTIPTVALTCSGCPASTPAEQIYACEHCDAPLCGTCADPDSEQWLCATCAREQHLAG